MSGTGVDIFPKEDQIVNIPGFVDLELPIHLLAPAITASKQP